jgi:hypothetical protein
MTELKNGHLIRAHDLLKDVEERLREIQGPGPAASINRTLEMAKLNALIGIGRELERWNQPLPFEVDCDDDDGCRHGQMESQECIPCAQEGELAFRSFRNGAAQSLED